MSVTEKTRRKAPPLAAAVLILTAPAVSYFEGRVPRTHRDPVGIASFCYGQTGAEAVPGRVAGPGECERLRDARILQAITTVQTCAGPKLELRHYAAFTSFEYNVGASQFCTSTLARKARSGDLAGACAELSKWKYSTLLGVKVVLSGLVKRRAAERQMCETGKWPDFVL